jgi:hypothetical protein
MDLGMTIESLEMIIGIVLGTIIGINRSQNTHRYQDAHRKYRDNHKSSLGMIISCISGSS